MGEINKDRMPWLIFEINGRCFAVNSCYVTEILKKPETLTPMPETPDIYMGMIERRGQIYPIISMRRLFSVSTVEEDCVEFDKVLDSFKDEHNNWVNTLRKCTEEGIPFTLTNDPKECSFGRWLSTFKSNNSAEDLLFTQMEEPHNALHRCANDLQREGINKEKVFRRLEKNYLPKMMQLFEDVKRAHRAAFKQSVVVITDGSINTVGLMVDRVIAVDSVMPVVGGENVNLLTDTEYFDAVVRNRRTEGDILTLNLSKFLGFADLEKIEL